jgi:hydrogenase maturation protease
MGQASSPTTLILGLGNPLSGDDGFGTQVIKLLHQHEKSFPPDTSLVDAHTDLLNYIEDFAAYDRVVLIDAILDPDKRLGNSGQIVVLCEEEFLSWSEASTSAHQMSPLLTVKLFRQLYPEAKTQISLVGLLVDQLTSSPRYATEDRLHDALAVLCRHMGITNG